MSTATKARPVHELRMGRIRAAIWANETQNGHTSQRHRQSHLQRWRRLEGLVQLRPRRPSVGGEDRGPGSFVDLRERESVEWKYEFVKRKRQWQFGRRRSTVLIRR